MGEARNNTNDRRGPWKSINQIAQETGDTSANEVARIRQREAAVKTAWRTIAYEKGTVTLSELAKAADLPREYCRLICERDGYEVSEG